MLVGTVDGVNVTLMVAGTHKLRAKLERLVGGVEDAGMQDVVLATVVVGPVLEISGASGAHRALNFSGSQRNGAIFNTSGSEKSNLDRSGMAVGLVPNW